MLQFSQIATFNRLKWYTTYNNSPGVFRALDSIDTRCKNRGCEHKN